MANEFPIAASKRRLWPILIGEAVFLAAAVAAMFYLDLGWIGAILIAMIVAVFTVMIFRAGEGNAREQGNFSPAMGRYNRRMLAASAVYVVGLFGAIWAHDNLGSIRGWPSCSPWRHPSAC